MGFRLERGGGGGCTLPLAAYPTDAGGAGEQASSATTAPQNTACSLADIWIRATVCVWGTSLLTPGWSVPPGKPPSSRYSAFQSPGAPEGLLCAALHPCQPPIVPEPSVPLSATTTRGSSTHLPGRQDTAPAWGGVSTSASRFLGGSVRMDGSVTKVSFTNHPEPEDRRPAQAGHGGQGDAAARGAGQSQSTCSP